MNASFLRLFERAQLHRLLALASWLLSMSCGGKTTGELPGAHSGIIPDKVIVAASSEQSPVTEPTTADSANQLLDPSVSLDSNPCAGNSPDSTCTSRLPLSLSPVPTEFIQARAAFENVLQTLCGECHGSQFADASEAAGGINFINNLDSLIEAGLVVTGSSNRSRIVEVMRNGTMPPPDSNANRSRADDIEAIVRFLDYPPFFPEPPWDGCGLRDISRNSVRAMLDDLQSLPAEQAAFTRYLSVGVQGAAYCTQQLDTQRRALRKMLNSLSIENELHSPPSFYVGGTFFRIDLRRYGWQRSVVVDGIEYSDAWEAIVASNPYAIPFEGAIAEQAMAYTQSTVPWMKLTRALAVAMRGNLYYALIGVDPEENLDYLTSEYLGINLQANRESARITRAGRFSTQTSEPSLLVERHSAATHLGAFWQLIELNAEDNLLVGAAQPLPQARQSIFPLANGMLAYVSSDGLNSLVPNQESTVNCTGCHLEGFLPLRSDAQQQLEAAASLPQEEQIFLESVYLDEGQVDIIMARDSQAYQRNLVQLNIGLENEDPLLAVNNRFEQPLLLEKVAFELVVSPNFLRDNLQDFPEVFSALATVGGTITRTQFTDSFVASLCVARRTPDFRPVSSLCQAAD